MTPLVSFDPIVLLKEEEVTPVIKAKPMPYFGVPFKPKATEPRQVEMCPFSFDSRDKARLLQKEKKIEELQKEEVGAVGKRRAGVTFDSAKLRWQKAHFASIAERQEDVARCWNLNHSTFLCREVDHNKGGWGVGETRVNRVLLMSWILMVGPCSSDSSLGRQTRSAYCDSFVGTV